jgi:hypothetical protein
MKSDVQEWRSRAARVQPVALVTRSTSDIGFGFGFGDKRVAEFAVKSGVTILHYVCVGWR